MSMSSSCCDSGGVSELVSVGLEVLTDSASFGSLGLVGGRCFCWCHGVGVSCLGGYFWCGSFYWFVLLFSRQGAGVRNVFGRCLGGCCTLSFSSARVLWSCHGFPFLMFLCWWVVGVVMGSSWCGLPGSRCAIVCRSGWRRHLGGLWFWHCKDYVLLNVLVYIRDGLLWCSLCCVVLVV